MDSTTPHGDRQARLERMLDRQDILDCILRFARGMDRFDRALFLSAYHHDATIDAGPFVGAPEALYDWASALHAQGQAGTSHLLLNHSADIDGESAHAETCYLFVGRNRDGSNWLAGGRYLMRLERRAGDWRIAMHCNALEWNSVLDGLPNPFADVPGLTLNGEARRDHDDISCRRPLTNRRPTHIPSRDAPIP